MCVCRVRGNECVMEKTLCKFLCDPESCLEFGWESAK